MEWSGETGCCPMLVVFLYLDGGIGFGRAVRVLLRECDCMQSAVVWALRASCFLAAEMRQ